MQKTLNRLWEWLTDQAWVQVVLVLLSVALCSVWGINDGAHAFTLWLLAYISVVMFWLSFFICIHPWRSPGHEYYGDDDCDNPIQLMTILFAVVAAGFICVTLVPVWALIMIPLGIFSGAAFCHFATKRSVE